MTKKRSINLPIVFTFGAGGLCEQAAFEVFIQHLASPNEKYKPAHAFWQQHFTFAYENQEEPTDD